MKIDFYDFDTGVLKQSTKSHFWQLHGFTDPIVMSVFETVKDIFNEIDSLFFQLIQNVSVDLHNL